MDPTYRLRLLGHIQVEQDGVLLRGFRSRKALALLGYLARQEQPVARSTLADLFWPDQTEARGRRNLSRELSHLSSLLPDLFQTDYHTVHLQRGDTYWVDTNAFAEIVKSIRGPTPLAQVSPDQMNEAIALYRGDFMSGHFLDDCPEFETWLVREQEYWRQQITQIFDQLIPHYLDHQQDDQAKTYLTRWLELEPWRERVHRHLMGLLARNGQRSAALAQYDTCRDILAEELGVDPSAETTALYQQIQNETFLPPPESKTVPSLTQPANFQTNLNRLSFPFGQHLFGVAEKRQQLQALLDRAEAPWLMALDGIGGIGKSSLAGDLLYESLTANRFFDGAWVSAKQEEFLPGQGIQTIDQPALTVETLTDALLQQLNPDPNHPASATEKQAILMALLKAQPYLIVVDNLESVVDHEALLPYLRQLAQPSKFILTTRHSLHTHSDVFCLSLAELSQADVFTFLRHEADSRGIPALAQASEEQLRRIYEVVGGNPLALKLVIGQIGRVPLSQMLINLQQAQGKKVDDLYTYIYWQAWHLLTNTSRQLFLLLPVNPNGSFSQLAAISQLEPDELQEAIEQLIALSLVEVNADIEEPRYRLHRLTESFLMTEVLKWQTPL